MSEDESLQRADAWMAEYKSICDELESQVVGVDGATCGVMIEVWERRHRDNPRVGSFVINHARTLQMMLRKNLSSGTFVVMQGDNLNFQQGSSNVSHSSGYIAAGDSNQIVDASTKNNVTTPGPLESAAKQYSNILAGVIAGLLAAWWCFPQWAAIGSTRLIVTVFLVIATVVLSLLSWFQFRRRNWEKFSYIGLGTILIVHSFVPSFAGQGSAKGEIDGAKAVGKVQGYVTFADEPIYATIQVALGVVALYFAFRTKPAPE